MSPAGNRHPNGEESTLIDAIKERLQQRGAAVDLSFVVRGRSGANHVFDLVMTKGASRIYFDVRACGDADIELKDVLETYAKSLDGKSKPAVLVAVPGASVEARKSAAAFGIRLLEARNTEELLGKLDSVASEAANA